MSYFGGGGVRGILHPSLRTYIDCFLSNPFPKGFPRGGGVWDQDPMLMRDFRIIREQDVKWKEQHEQMEQIKNRDPNDMSSQQEGGGGGLEGALGSYLEDMEEDGLF